MRVASDSGSDRPTRPARENPPYGIVVGLVSEARIARRLGWPVKVGGGGPEGAAEAARLLAHSGVAGLVSFGLAGGIDPGLRAGEIIVPSRIRVNGQLLTTDPALSAKLGGATDHILLAANTVAGSPEEKRRLWDTHHAAALDLETGAVAGVAAAFGLPFAALRAICDPAQRSLPPAALIALDSKGAISLLRVAVSVLRQPWQLPGLLSLAREAAAARHALIRRIDAIRT